MQIPSTTALVQRLQRHPDVIGLVRYGGRRVGDMAPGGDLDLFVFLKGEAPPVESLHLYVGKPPNEIPVDLNVRTLEDLEREEPLTPIDRALVGGEIVYDPGGALQETLPHLAARWPEPVPPLHDHDIAFERFSKTHILDKVRGRLDSQPTLCAFLLHTNIYWLVQSYFGLRQMAYPGEKPALGWLEIHESDLYAQVAAFYETTNLEEQVRLTEALTVKVLEPVGGPWRRDEVLAFGRAPDAPDLQERGRALFQRLLGADAPGPRP